MSTFADVHVHLREPGGTQKEDFETGTMAAIAGGYTQVLDMPNNNPPTATPEALQEKENLAKDRIWCDVGFNFGATKESCEYFKVVKKNVFGIKVYMSQTTGPLLITEPEERDVIFKHWDSNLPIMIHARDEIVEVAIKLAEKYDRKIHICHITANQIQTVLRAKKQGVKISSEVCPHHLFLTEDNLGSLGPFGLMKPPLLTKKESQKLWEYIDRIDMISTDHAPHTVEEKFDQLQPKFGVPGLETTLPLMLWAVKRKLISQQRMIEMLSISPRRIFNFPVQPDTYMEVNLSKEYTIGSKKLFTKCQWTPFKKLNGVGEIKKVVMKGETVFENGHFVGKPAGEIIHPSV